MQLTLRKQKLGTFLFAILIVAVLTFILVYGKGKLFKGFGIGATNSGGQQFIQQTAPLTLPEEAQACNVMGGTFAIIRDNAICVVGDKTYQWDQRRSLYKRIRNLD